MCLHLMNGVKELFHPRVMFLLLLFPLPFCIIQQLFQNLLLHSFEREREKKKKLLKWEYNLLPIQNDLMGYRKSSYKYLPISPLFPVYSLKQTSKTTPKLFSFLPISVFLCLIWISLKPCGNRGSEIAKES